MIGQSCSEQVGGADPEKDAVVVWFASTLGHRVTFSTELDEGAKDDKKQDHEYNDDSDELTRYEVVTNEEVKIHSVLLCPDDFDARG